MQSEEKGSVKEKAEAMQKKFDVSSLPSAVITEGELLQAISKYVSNTGY